MPTVRQFASREHGTSLIELMVAISVLTVGLAGAIIIISLAIGSNLRTKKDTTSVALAQMVISQMAAVPVGGSTTTVTLTDCAGNNATVNTSGTAAGSGANLTGSGNIDFSQSFGAVPAGYGMNYTVCSMTNGIRAVYDVRWNVRKLPSGKEEFVVVGAQSLNGSSANGWLTALPVNVRTIVGNDGD
jgi:prepilin-type N-terminal cleavage/methylation domain-containing protein